MAQAKRRPPWKRSNPKQQGEHTRLSSYDEKRARQRARRAGRRYPNLADNMWAAQTKKARRKQK